VVVRVHQLVEPRQHVVEWARLVDAVDGEGRHAAQRHRGDGAQRTEAHAHGAQLVAAADVAQLAAPVHEADPHDLRGEVSEAGSGAVRGRGDGARQRLWIDVALILHGEAA
jgi:hypothetical protein